jgi:preprotein translocase subunit SecG
MIIHVSVSLGLIFFVLLHSGKAGGLADMFGGGASSTFSSTSIIQKNLDRITIALALTFAVTTILLIRL